MWRIQLLGSLQAQSDTQVVSDWPSPDAELALAYLALTRPATETDEAIAAALWPAHGADRLAAALRELQRLFGEQTALQTTPLGLRLTAPGVAVDAEDFLTAARAALASAEPAYQRLLLPIACALYTGPLLPGIEHPWVNARRAELAEQFSTALLAQTRLLATDGQPEAALRAARRGVAVAPGVEVVQLEAARLAQELGQPLELDTERTVRAATPSPGAALPTGAVTFLFTDIRGSTRLWEERPNAIAEALGTHDELLRAAVQQHGGTIFKHLGDGCCAAFGEPLGALSAALEAQFGLQRTTWPEGIDLQVRMALHTGEPICRDNDYFGPPLNRVARLLGVTHAGQIILSLATREMVQDRLPDGVKLLDLGTHRLRDLERAERVTQAYQAGLRADFPPLRSLDYLPHNLPQQVTSFVGRESDLDEVKRLLLDSRLVTITGAGGSGKTRLALQAAADLLTGEGDGVWLVDLAPVRDPDLLPRAVAATLGVDTSTGRDPTDAVTTHLRDRRLLLLLDNCEHLIDSVAALVDRLLASCSEVAILATSREVLALSGERRYHLAPMTLEAGIETVDQALESEAVQLLVDRARQAQAEFELTPDNVATVVEICRRLDGLPLAIELAAARFRTMTPVQVAERLRDRFRLLSGARGGSSERQRSLEAAITWSYELLAESERLLLQRLSCFRGGGRFEAIESICTDDRLEDWDLPELLSGLVDKSLVVFEEHLGRYRMLESIRDYARARATLAGEFEAVVGRHAEYFLALAEQASDGQSGRRSKYWADELEAEHDNYRAVLDRVQEVPALGETALQLAGRLAWFWSVRGHWQEGRRRLEQLLASSSGSTLERQLAAHGAGLLALCLSASEEAQRWAEEAFGVAVELGDRQAQARELHLLGRIAQRGGQVADAERQIEQARSLQAELGDRAGLAVSLASLGGLAAMQRRLPEAQALYEQALRLMRELGDQPGVAYTLGSLANVLHHQGQLGQARALHEESLALQREQGDSRGLVIALVNLGVTAARQDDLPAARAAYEEALALARGLHDELATATILTNLSGVLTSQGAGDTVMPLLLESRAICARLGDQRLLSYCLRDLGRAAERRGDPAAAWSHYCESLELRRRLGQQHGLAELLEALAGLSAESVPARAAACVGVARQLREKLAEPLSETQQAALEQALAPARVALGQGWEQAVEQGALQGLDPLCEALRSTPRQPGA